MSPCRHSRPPPVRHVLLLINVTKPFILLIRLAVRPHCSGWSRLKMSRRYAGWAGRPSGARPVCLASVRMDEHRLRRRWTGRFASASIFSRTSRRVIWSGVVNGFRLSRPGMIVSIVTSIYEHCWKGEDIIGQIYRIMKVHTSNLMLLICTYIHYCFEVY